MPAGTFLKIVPLEHDTSQARDYLNERSLQIGRILPVGDGLLGEFFATASSYVLLKGRVVDALFSYNAGREKQSPTARFRVVTDSVSGLREATRLVEETAVAGEKMVLRTNVFGYDKKRLQAFKAWDTPSALHCQESYLLMGGDSTITFSTKI